MTTYNPAAYREFFERGFTYLAGFRRNTHRYADRVALHCPLTNTSWTYAELGSRVDRLAAGLVEAGGRPGDVGGYQFYNGPEFPPPYPATQAGGAVGAPINFPLGPGATAVIPHAHHDALVPPWRPVRGRTEPRVLRGRAGRAHAGVRSQAVSGLRGALRTHLSHRSAHDPGDVGPHTGGTTPRPVHPVGDRHYGSPARA